MRMIWRNLGCCWRRGITGRQNQVRELIKREFGVEFTTRHIPRILRKLGLRYQKPFVNDYRRPVDAEGILKKDYWGPRWTTGL